MLLKCQKLNHKNINCLLETNAWFLVWKRPSQIKEQKLERCLLDVDDVSMRIVDKHDKPLFNYWVRSEGFRPGLSYILHNQYIVQLLG